MARTSAGLIMYRWHDGRWQVFLVHPGGPFWRKKDLGAWSIPKGESSPEEDPLAAAKREFQEETSFTADGLFMELAPVKQPGGKIIRAWAFEGDCDPAAIKSNVFWEEWPPRSGKRQAFPEVDRAAWFDIEEAKARILKGQVPLLVELQRKLSSRSASAAAPAPAHSREGPSTQRA